jgi:RNA polymerase sigma-70 factor (ECF subfamily)
VSERTAESLLSAALPHADAVSPRRREAEMVVLAIFDRSAPHLLRYVTSLGLNVEESEDVVQETLLALFRHVQLGRDQTNLYGWVFQVAHNLALKRRQQQLKRRPAASPDPIGARADNAPDPEERLLGDERSRRLRSVFRALPDRERQCLVLRADGLTYRDIARSLGVSLGAVSKAVTRAVTRLMNADGG